MKNIVLIGFMGCGKTTYGKKLSKYLDYDFIDTDDYIEAVENMSISEIFSTKGEYYFRKLEREVINDISSKTNTVISTGGGIIKSEHNMSLLSKNGIIVYLEASPEKIYSNIGDDLKRPLLQGGNKMEKIKALLGERMPIYNKYSDLTVNVSWGCQDDIFNRIIKALEDRI